MKILVFFSFLFLSSLVNVQAQRVVTPKDSAVRQMKPISDKAIVFIVRPSEYGYRTSPYMQVFCDNKNIGMTDFSTYLYTIENPGNYTFISKAENKAKLDLNVEAGKIYYIEQQVKMGIGSRPRTKLNLITEETALKFLQKCILSPLLVVNQD